MRSRRNVECVVDASVALKGIGFCLVCLYIFSPSNDMLLFDLVVRGRVFHFVLCRSLRQQENSKSMAKRIIY